MFLIQQALRMRCCPNDRGGFGDKNLGIIKNARQHPNDVAVNNGDRFVLSDTRNRGGGVGTDARTGQ